MPMEGDRMRVGESAELVTGEGDIDLRVLVGILWRAKWWIVTGTLAFAAAAAFYALNAQVWYQAGVSVVQVESSSPGGQLGQLGGLASLAGINLNSGPELKVSMAVLRSEEFVRDFIEEKQLLPELLRGTGQEARQRTGDPAKDWDLRDATRFFDKEVREINEDKRSGVVRLDIAWIEPATAAEWANDMVKRANERLRAQSQEVAERNVKYLQTEIANTNVSAMQQSLSKILESEMQKFLLAKGNEEFAFRVVDRAIAPKTKIRPKRVLLVAAGAFAGALVSVIAVLAVQVLGRRRPRTHAA
jgi:uncharacterized protein involved in exopolysaccharide biosynthesis